MEPTVSRIVHYYPVEGDPGYAPGRALAAIVCRVERDANDDFRLNLAVFGVTGRQYCREDVLLYQDSEKSRPNGGHAEWPPRVEEKR